jgi:hypothetical protein
VICQYDSYGNMTRRISMSTIMTIISCVLISQLAAGEQAAPVEPRRAASAEVDQSSADPFSRSVQAGNPTGDQSAPAELPETSISDNTAAPPTVPSTTIPETPATLRKHPPELVAEAMALPSGSAIGGQGLALVQALSASADRRGQLAIAHAYWQAVEAAAEYHYCLEHVNQLERLQSRPQEDVMLQAARWAARAALCEAELAASAAQHELAALMQLPADATLPLPADRPHVGAYRTNYQELFAQRPAPDRARLIDRTLPVRRMAVDQRAVAVQAAEDALSAAIDLYQAGQGSLESVVSSSDQLLRQQRAFIESVCRYNHDIAEYAMSVASPGLPPQALVGFMITPARQPGQGTSLEAESEVQPAGLNQPAPTPANREGNRQSPLAPLRGGPDGSVIPTTPSAGSWAPGGAPVKTQPTLAPPRDGTTHREKNEAAPLLPRGLVPFEGKNAPALAPPRPETKPAADDETTSPAPQSEEGEKIRYSVGDPFSRRAQRVQKIVAELAAASDSAGTLKNTEGGNEGDAVSASSAAEVGEAASALYPALVEAKPAARAKQLTLALHWDRSLPEGAGKAMTLEECLSRQSGTAGQAGSGARRAAVEVFWIARQRAAEYQVLAQEIEFLDSLTPIVLERRGQSRGAAAMLYLRSMQRSAAADLQEARAALIEAQFELAVRTQTVAEGDWPLPATC